MQSFASTACFRGVARPDRVAARGPRTTRECIFLRPSQGVRPKTGQEFVAGLACNALSRALRRSYVQTDQEFIAGLACNALSRELRRSTFKLTRNSLQVW